jgi:hypothetical protein
MRGRAHIQLAPLPTVLAQWWYHTTATPSNHDLILQGILAGTALWVTDGSYKDPYGSAAFTLLPHLDATDGITLVNQTPGRDNEMDAYRAEVCGIYGCLAFTNELLQHHRISTGSITMACDCKPALLNIFEKCFDKPAQSHYDVIHACQLLRAASPIKWTSRHVYGHQDK